MGRRIFRCEFDGKMLPLRLWRDHPYRGQIRLDNICLISNGDVDIAEVGQGAQLATIERWGTSCMIEDPLPWYQSYILYFKRLIFEELEHKVDDDYSSSFHYDLIHFSADEILMAWIALKEETSSSGYPTFDPKNQERMWHGEDFWHKLNENGEWEKCSDFLKKI